MSKSLAASQVGNRFQSRKLIANWSRKSQVRQITANILQSQIKQITLSTIERAALHIIYNTCNMFLLFSFFGKVLRMYVQEINTEIQRKKLYISVTFDPEHVIPFHDWPQGSPPLDFQPSNWEGEFMLVYMTLRAETEKITRHKLKMQ